MNPVPATSFTSAHVESAIPRHTTDDGRILETSGAPVRGLVFDGKRSAVPRQHTMDDPVGGNPAGKWDSLAARRQRVVSLDVAPWLNRDGATLWRYLRLRRGVIHI
jgi:hypothetical protein